MAAARSQGILALLGEDEEKEPKRGPRDPMADDSEEDGDMEDEGDDEAEEAGLELADAIEARDGKRVAEAFARLLEVT